MPLTFEQFIDNDLFSDCTVTVKDMQYKCHRVILAATSDYFRAILTTKLKANDNVNLPHVAGAIMDILLQFMYKGTCNLTEDNAFQVYTTADYLAMPQVQQICTQYLVESINLTNCIRLHLFSKMYFIQALQTPATMYVLRNMKEIIKERPQDFLNLELNDLIELVNSDYLNLSSEEKLWEAILFWVEHKPEERNSHLPTLLPTVRLNLLSPEYFLNEIRNHPAIAENEECQPIFSETLRLLFDFDVDSFQSLARYRIPNDIVFVMGGWTIGSPTNSIEVYDMKADNWITIQEVDPKGPRAYHGTVVVNHQIFVIGGYNGYEYFNSCRSFNIETRTWRDIAPMNRSRCYVSVTFCGDYIYAMGGYNGNRRQNTAERYNVNTNQWTLIANMYFPRSDACATTFEGKVYIFGGFNGHACLSSGEVYDPELDKWEMIMTPMSTRRSGVSCTTFQDHIYVLGGFNGRNRLSSGEKFHPRTQHWTEIPNMIHDRSNFSIVVIDDYILVIGGYDGSATTSHVERYYPESGQWWITTSLNVARSALSACVATNFPGIETYSFNHHEENTTPYMSTESSLL